MPVEVAERTEQRLSRRSFLKAGVLAAGGLALYAGEIERHWIETREITIQIRNLPEEFRGFRIAQLADFHYGEFSEPTFIRAAVAQTNALKPDLVTLTGDFVSAGPMVERISKQFGHHCAELLQKLQCPQRFSVLGNHDAMVGEAAIADALNSHGLNLLQNRAMPIERGGSRIWLAGVGDVMIGHADVAKALPKTAARDKEPVILMAHEPDFADVAARYPVDLMLSGHTHGGQVRIPFMPPLNLPPLGEKYVEGRFVLGNLQLYVNRGIGTVGLPFRFLCPPEITLITLA